MIRDPISRFESFYYFSRFGNVKGGGGKARLSEEQRLETVDECVANRRRECLQPVWQVVPYICGMRKECLQRHSEAVRIAKVRSLFIDVIIQMKLFFVRIFLSSKYF